MWIAIAAVVASAALVPLALWRWLHFENHGRAAVYWSSGLRTRSPKSQRARNGQQGSRWRFMFSIGSELSKGSEG